MGFSNGPENSPPRSSGPDMNPLSIGPERNPLSIGPEPETTGPAPEEEVLGMGWRGIEGNDVVLSKAAAALSI